MSMLDILMVGILTNTLLAKLISKVDCFSVLAKADGRAFNKEVVIASFTLRSFTLPLVNLLH